MLRLVSISFYCVLWLFCIEIMPSAARAETSAKTAAAKTSVKSKPAVTAAQSNDDARLYQQCTTLSTSDPNFALRMADDWAKRAPASPAMQHCRALGLFGLKRYTEAAETLERVADIVAEKQPVLWLSLLKQAATARIAAGDSAKALRSLTVAVQTAAERSLNDMLVDLLTERARLHITMKNPLKAVQDYDHALSISENNAELLMKRAQLFIEIKQYALAKNDLATIVAINPGHTRAKELLQGLVP